MRRSTQVVALGLRIFVRLSRPYGPVRTGLRHSRPRYEPAEFETQQWKVAESLNFVCRCSVVCKTCGALLRLKGHATRSPGASQSSGKICVVTDERMAVIQYKFGGGTVALRTKRSIQTSGSRLNSHETQDSKYVVCERKNGREDDQMSRPPSWQYVFTFERLTCTATHLNNVR